MEQPHRTLSGTIFLGSTYASHPGSRNDGPVIEMDHLLKGIQSECHAKHYVKKANELLCACSCSVYDNRVGSVLCKSGGLRQCRKCTFME